MFATVWWPCALRSCARPVTSARCARTAASLGRRRAALVVAAAVEVCLGEQRFESKSAAVNYVRDTLRKLVNTVVRPGDANFEVLLALFERHPHDQKKVEQPPVAAFRVVPNATLPQYCQLEFTDGRGVWEAISYKKCIDQKHDPPNIKHEEALRSVVEAQVLAFGAQQPQQCARCGTKQGPLQTRQYADALAGFHAEHATMQLLCPACHKKKSTRQTGAQAAIARSAKKAVK
ncbi:lupus la [Micractinium conductrix]|uniref:Lupus la n=1 Tax=Micractinium conductrix TaxID=554055 RepID=A0A2P6VKM9_9CHLO|nr:lupus la [Micractinium conductrix]|eukprot:PSC74656.1 lupus la [Micractinium conductrix]